MRKDSVALHHDSSLLFLLTVCRCISYIHSVLPVIMLQFVLLSAVMLLVFDLGSQNSFLNGSSTPPFAFLTAEHWHSLHRAAAMLPYRDVMIVLALVCGND